MKMNVDSHWLYKTTRSSEGGSDANRLRSRRQFFTWQSIWMNHDWLEEFLCFKWQMIGELCVAYLNFMRNERMVFIHKQMYPTINEQKETNGLPSGDKHLWHKSNRIDHTSSNWNSDIVFSSDRIIRIETRERTTNNLLACWMTLSILLEEGQI